MSETTDIEKRGPGRPKKTLDTIKVDGDMIERLAWEFHASREKIATILGMDDDTLRRRFEEDPELLASYERGHVRRERWVIERLFRRLNKPDCPPALYIFALKNVCGWVDAPKTVKHVGADGGPIQHVARYAGPAGHLAVEAGGEDDDEDEEDVVDAEAEEVAEDEGE